MFYLDACRVSERVSLVSLRPETGNNSCPTCVLQREQEVQATTPHTNRTPTHMRRIHTSTPLLTDFCDVVAVVNCVCVCVNRHRVLNTCLRIPTVHVVHSQRRTWRTQTNGRVEPTWAAARVATMRVHVQCAIATNGNEPPERW